MVALHRFFARLDAWLSGWPDMALTILLLVIAAILVVVAFTATPKVKAGTALWAVFP